MRTRDGLFKMLGLCLLAGVLVAGLLFPIVGAAGVISNQASDTVESMSSDLADVPPPLVTTVTDSAGNPIATLYEQYRIPTAPDEISDAMKWALISVEDRRFYEHHGVDWKGTIRAAVSNTSGGDTQGASTLTQQYVKNYLINVIYRNDELGQQRAQEVSVARKLKEARIAIQLETKLSKEQILAGYLNVVEFSRRIFGVGAAAQAYFNTTADKLTVTQSALLAGMVNNPAVYDPWNNPERATERRNWVLDKMVENLKLSREDAERLKAEPLGVVPDGPSKPAANCIGAGPENGFFCQYVEDYLLSHGMDKEELYTGGYTIRTTMDQRANHEAKRSAEEQVSKTQDNVANTLSLVRPGKKRHEVVALAANKDYGTDASQGQTVYALPSSTANVTGAGSSYKMFTAAAILEQRKYGIYDPVQVPGSYTSRVFMGGGESCPYVGQGTRAYCVSNAGSYPGSMTLQQALATSPNTAFVILEEQAGMKAVVDMAYKLGMRSTMTSNAATGGPVDRSADNQQISQSQREYFGPSERSPGKGSFTLGVSPTNGLELANVAATIMSGGVWCPPTPIARITDRDGAKVPIEEKPCEQVVPEGLANSMAVGMSKDDQPGGTAAAAAAAANWTRPMIGKTGTTQNNGSAAFIGATPQLAGAAMVFRPDHPNGGLVDGGPGNVYATEGTYGNMFGGKTPARTWFGAMTKILEGQPPLPLPPAHPRYERVR
ncbi:membrane peptidoglycan carboxypeptidase [Saccharomonospora amisosensis]|uniref:Membrane peptidoglycan carboxypeptidase n=1 Tax=Saccharomonospora amisosensis TaxID=1128677 RepID=A0A7X5ULR8_9PSEU|nr:transglycosylase domain-containing protein [Saccharomonospora amisosensis]NIJ10019.1 membrane peptidoglycan carboxypeptidase [Saccharomonospora amisosensis]